MKKLISILAALMLLGGIAVSEGIDYASLTDDQLHEIIDLARNELARRELVAQEKTVLFEQDGVQLYLTGNYKVDEWGEGKHVLQLEAVVVNESDRKISVHIDTVSVNGWNVYGGSISNIDAGKKKKGSFEIRLYDADIHSYEEIEDIEFSFKVLDESYSRIFSTETPITVHFNRQ